MTATTEPQTRTLDVPGATLAYDVREAEGETSEPVLLLIGSPMDASGFDTLAGYFPDRTIVTYDPRGVSRSTRTDDGAQTTPEIHADDLHRLIAALDVGAIDIFGSSGGASNGLALVARHPEQVSTLVAHEPPLAMVLPDRAEATSAAAHIHETYTREGTGPAMAKFMMLTMHQGPIPADFPEWPVNPADFGLPTEDDGTRDDPLLANMVGGTHAELDYEAIRAAATRVVIAAGVESGETFTARTAFGVAERLGIEPMMFPSHHGGFLGGEFGYAGQPEAFAARLREVLSEDD